MRPGRRPGRSTEPAQIRFRIFRNGPRIERAKSNLDAAEAHLLTLAPDSYILGQMPCLLNHVQCHLPPTDARRQEFERIAQKLGIKDPDHPLLQKDKDSSPAAKEAIVKDERRKIINIVRGASSAALREHVRLRSFRNVVVITATLMAAAGNRGGDHGLFPSDPDPHVFRSSGGWQSDSRVPDRPI